MPKDEMVYVGHMLDKAHDALSLARGKTRHDYDNDLALRLALTHLIQVIGEAARRVSSQFRERHPHISWDAIAGMRSKIVHDYMNVDEDNRLGFSDSGASAVDRGSQENRSTRAMTAAFFPLYGYMLVLTNNWMHMSVTWQSRNRRST